ncbi:Pimeloyl-ACP methyl ester carboxylesterase [Saccharopolyspora antimicrobica]|uniref:Pimeloyl-ACP methyl ester carboxylesterase n=1 Tax=Saccharopolyspora antimicrobica TaxID=455193 RepID=A0A1I5IH00_9PSEU|nr:alpha/beta fold hydrolase [Saccharopolyspora antimicrobica]RKT85486.1 pimeloyl-ACP methyl ester carboxylesterase [Saccharopolyspora antimicrobica]SFO59351.1 Pimeloyl-ACP methyl ester carboxylesterase [Saccharopolyspora antimicrobica]
MDVSGPDRLGRHGLSDGRNLAWAEWGPQDGKPVVLCPGAATSRHLGFGTDVVDALGIRLISVDRPGLGASDPAPGRTLDSFADDIAELRRTVLGSAGLAVVGYSAGGPFALACAAAGVASRAAVVAGADEFASFGSGLPDDLRSMVELVAADPAAAEQSFAEFGSAEALWQLITRFSPGVDLAVYRSPGFEPVFRKAMAEGFAQGPAGYARDTVLDMGRWPFDVADIRIPVDLWYGALDTSPSHSPDHGVTLAQRIPAARHHLVADAGGSLLWTHAEEILRGLVGTDR